jgi:uncharacterized damage-inducible protein DinB
MSALIRPVVDERDGLLAYLAQQRYVLRLTAYGLTDEQARAAPPASALSIGGIIKHLSIGEQGWTDAIRQRPPTSPPEFDRSFRMGPDETLTAVLDRYAEVAADTEALVGDIDDMDQAVPVPPGSGWAPRDVPGWSVRWVLLHLIAETARHAGHADLIRESIDQATALPLMAAAEGWRPSRWIQPWEPPQGSIRP